MTIRPLLFLLSFLLAACTGALGVANDSPDALAIQTALTPNEAFRTAMEAVEASGYHVTRADSTRRTFETAPRVRHDLTVSISGDVRGGTPAVVVLRGRFSIPDVCDEGPVRRVGEVGCRALQAWEEIERVAARIDGAATPVLTDTLTIQTP